MQGEQEKCALVVGHACMQLASVKGVGRCIRELKFSCRWEKTHLGGWNSWLTEGVGCGVAVLSSPSEISTKLQGGFSKELGLQGGGYYRLWELSPNLPQPRNHRLVQEKWGYGFDLRFLLGTRVAKTSSSTYFSSWTKEGLEEVSQGKLSQWKEGTLGG